MNVLNERKILKAMKLEVIPKFKTLPEVCDFVTKYMLERYYLLQREEINCGYCFIWALYVWALWDGREKISFISSSGHVFLKVGRLYYDARHVEGTMKRLDITCMNVEKLNLFQMVWYWGQRGRQKRRFTGLLNRIAPKVLREVKPHFYSKKWNEDNALPVMEARLALPERMNA
jgi:hypothetical protein